MCPSRLVATLRFLSNGSHNDASIFLESEIGKLLKEGKLNLPRGRERLPGSNTLAEYFFIRDEGFPLSKNIIRPYSGKNLDEKKRIFNYRLSCARRTIENAFGILVSRWRVLRTIICMQPNAVDKIIMSAVCLHNFLKSFEEQQLETDRCYCPPGFVDIENNNGNIINGAWRENNIPIPSIPPSNAHRATVEAYEEQNKLADYFLTPEGQVPWQLEYVRKGQNRDEI
ncbi:Nuclease harbi1-like protein [Camponotus japonicus]